LNYKNEAYTLTAEGEIKSTETRSDDSGESEVWHNVENYKLYLKTANTEEQLIIAENNFNDTFVVLIFAGDIDRDGKLDFIFEANRDYEETRMLLFLSSDAGEHKTIRKAAEIAIQHDC